MKNEKLLIEVLGDEAHITHLDILCERSELGLRQDLIK